MSINRNFTPENKKTESAENISPHYSLAALVINTNSSPLVQLPSSSQIAPHNIPNSVSSEIENIPQQPIANTQIQNEISNELSVQQSNSIQVNESSPSSDIIHPPLYLPPSPSENEDRERTTPITNSCTFEHADTEHEEIEQLQEDQSEEEKADTIEGFRLLLIRKDEETDNLHKEIDELKGLIYFLNQERVREREEWAQEREEWAREREEMSRKIKKLEEEITKLKQEKK